MSGKVHLMVGTSETVCDIYKKTEESYHVSTQLMDQACIILSLFSFPWGGGGIKGFNCILNPIENLEQYTTLT